MKGIYQQMKESPVFDSSRNRALTKPEWEDILKRIDSQGERIHLTLHHVPERKPLTKEEIDQLWEWLGSEEATESLKR